MRYFSGLTRRIEVQHCSECIVSTRGHYPQGTMLGTIDKTYQKAWSLFPGEVEIYNIPVQVYRGMPTVVHSYLPTDRQQSVLVKGANCRVIWPWFKPCLCN